MTNKFKAMKDKVEANITREIALGEIDELLAKSKHDSYIVRIDDAVGVGQMLFLDREEAAYVCFRDRATKEAILGKNNIPH